MIPEATEMFRLGTRILRAAARLQNERPTPRRTMASIASEMAAQQLVSLDVLRTPCRARIYFKPRARIMLAQYREGYSYPQIGRYWKRDHTSVL